MRPVDTSFTGGDNAQFCAFAKTYTERSGAVGTATTPAQLRVSLQEPRAAIGQMLGDAPAEIKPEVQVVANVFGAVITELERVDFRPEQGVLG